MDDFVIRQIAAKVMLQAVKDYFNSAYAKRQIILKDLRGTWMMTLTNGTSANVAEQLEKNPKEIWERFRRHSKKEELL
jgi:hypothetical protein